MGSIAAGQVAKEVLESLGKGKKINLGKIMRKNGYAGNTADNPKNVTETETFKGIVNPVVLALEEERKKIIERLKKTRNKAKYRDLIDGLDKVTKNIQLLSGGKTDNSGVQISWE